MKKKKLDTFFFLQFFEIAQKKVTAVNIVNTLQVFLKSIKQKRPLEKK